MPESGSSCVPCKTCRNLDISNFERYFASFRQVEDVEIDEDLKRDIIEQSAINCCFCMLLNLSLLKLGDWNRATLYVRQGNRPVVVHLGQLRDGTQKADQKLELYRPVEQDSSYHPSTDDPWRNFPTAREISDAGSVVGYQFARDCLRSCLDDHKACRTSAASAFPTRLIYTPKPESSVRLVNSVLDGETYVALSHCWGKEPLIKTTTSTLSSRMTSIEWNLLPRTFQDAICVAHQFNISYVWIDSLCIIQDEKHDWEVESAKMGDIYRNAYFTIAADSSSGPGISFLSPHRPFPTYDFKFPSLNNSEVTIRARLTDEDDGVHCLSSRDPLHRRAWTYQERQLSARVLHFTSRELKWECRTMVCSEAYIHSEPSLTLGSGSLLPAFGPVDEYVQWQFFVMIYSHRDLTVASDKLPAISGIARDVHRLNSSEYLAGIWRNNILDDLYWETDWLDVDTVTSLKPATIYRCPSFSWASLDGPIGYGLFRFYAGYGTKKEYCATLLDGKCTLAGKNPFGEVSDGFIKLSGPLTAFELVYSPRRDIKPRAQDDHFRYSLRSLKALNEENVQGKSGIELLVDTNLVLSHDSHFQLKRVSERGSEDAFASTVWLFTLYSEDGTPNGLVLTPCSRGNGLYGRIGVFKADGYNKTSSCGEIPRPPRQDWFTEVCQVTTVTIV